MKLNQEEQSETEIKQNPLAGGDWKGAEKAAHPLCCLLLPFWINRGFFALSLLSVFLLTLLLGRGSACWDALSDY